MPARNAKFYQVLEEKLAARNSALASIYDEADVVEQRILDEYGAIFLAMEEVLPPPVCMFTSAEEVEAFQSKAGFISAEINGAEIELQPAAMKALLAARQEAHDKELDITPRGGTEAARRSYDDTLRLWNSRFLPACEHWKSFGRLTDEKIEYLKSLPIKKQVKAILELEKDEIFFNTFFNRSILYSVAAPGTSQHLSMLAIDIEQFRDEKVRQIMGNHGWFRTVQNDEPHFTFLGRRESELKELGLKKLETEIGEYWIPAV
jgi:hypothetical protein